MGAYAWTPVIQVCDGPQDIHHPSDIDSVLLNFYWSTLEQSTCTDHPRHKPDVLRHVSQQGPNHWNPVLYLLTSKISIAERLTFCATVLFAVINAISHIRDVVAGTTSPALDSGIMDSTGAQTLAPTNSYSLLNARNVTQVLQIVYLGGMGKGGFFPAGMNGLFK